MNDINFFWDNSQLKHPNIFLQAIKVDFSFLIAGTQS